ncbi:MAG: T9SS type A sorting domain-containing protein [Calditrichaeota bacterium]|nr:T9SS type A sorting domain-containing protein [Calditrichota bacterium]
MFQKVKKAGKKFLFLGGLVLSLSSPLLWAQSETSSEKSTKSTILQILNIEINPDGAGSVTKTPDKANYDAGEKVTLKANAGGRYQFLNWSGDIDRLGYNPVDIHMEENRTIVANFVIQDNNKITSPNKPSGSTSAQTGEWLTFRSGGANSSIGGSVEYLYDWGDGRISEWGGSTRTYAFGKSGSYNVRVRARSTAEPNTVSGWSASLSVRINGPDKHILTITIEPENAGRVEITPEQDGYDDGDQVKLQAIPNAGYRFDRWTDGLKSTTNPVNIYMLKSRSITANFVKDGGGGGDTETVTTPDKPDGPTSGQIDTDVQFVSGNAASSLGHEVEYQFDFGDGNQSGWGNDHASHRYAATGAFNIKARARCAVHTNIVSNWSPSATINITGEQANYVLTVLADPEAGGTVQKDPDKDTYAQNERVALHATPNLNYRFDHWSGDISYYTDNPINIYMRRSRTIIANFIYEGGEQVTVPDTVIGPAAAYKDVEISFATGGSQSSLGHPVEYQFDFGDGSQSFWGDSVQTHTYTEVGTFSVKARARCSEDVGAQSGWSKSIDIVINELLEGNTLDVSVDPLNSGIVQIQPRKNLYADNETVLLYAIPSNGNGPFDGNIYVEAETGTLSGNFWVETDTTASENMYIYGTQGSPRDGDAIYHVIIETTGNYFIWGRCYALADTEDSFFFLVDDGDTLTWHLDKDYNKWKWQKVSDQHQVQQFNLTAGEHELRVIKRDKKARLDKLIITRDGGFEPSGKMAVANEDSFSFQYWGGDLAGTDNPTQLTMDGDKNVTAHFVSGTAEMVSAPTMIDGPDSGFVGDTLTFTTNGAIDNKGNPIQYQFDWGDGNLSGWGDSSAVHIFQASQLYEIKTRARSTADTLVVSGWSPAFVIQIYQETVSVPTSLTGPDSVFVGKNVTFVTSGALDNRGTAVEYQFDWGDGQQSPWGDSSQTYVYADSGDFSVKARARSIVNPAVMSDWSQFATIIVRYEPVPHFSIYITINPETKGTVTKEPDKQEYAKNDTVKLTAVAIEGYNFDNWSGDLEGTENPIFVVLTRDMNVTANFSEVVESVSTPLTPTGPDSGMIGEQLTFVTTGAACNLGHEVEYQFDWGDSTLSDWGKNTRQHIFSYSDTMEIRARARCKENSSVISDWSDIHKVLIVKSFNYFVNIIVDPQGSGTVNRTPFKSSYESGEVVILSPLPLSGYVFDHWSGDVTGIQNPEFLIIDGNKNVTAHFKNITGVERIDKEIPDEFSLSQNYPNPFNPTTTINFQLANSGRVNLQIYNIKGQQIKKLVDSYQSAGYYQVLWDATDQNGMKVPSGIYFYQIHTDEFTQIRKMTLLK